MKKVLGTRENLQFGPWLQSIDPLKCLLHRHQLIFVALHDRHGHDGCRVRPLAKR